VYRIWFERAPSPSFMHLLDDAVSLLGPANATPETPFIALPSAEGIIAAARLRYDDAVMAQAPGLRVIARVGIGVDNIDLEAATRRGIAVCNAPDGPTISTAEHTILLLLAVVKELRQIDRLMRQGGKVDFFNAYHGREACGLTLGLVGVGRIGGQVAKIAHTLGMQVLAFDPFAPVDRPAALQVERTASLEALLRQSDVVSLHLPLSAATYQLIDAARIAQMKPGAYLINTARGGLVDEAALLAGLEQGHLRGAGLDVFHHEPPDPSHPLLQRDDVIATPHIAGVAEEAKQRLWHTAIKQVLQVLRGERPQYLVNSLG